MTGLAQAEANRVFNDDIDKVLDEHRGQLAVGNPGRYKGNCLRCGSELEFQPTVGGVLVMCLTCQVSSVVS